MNKYSDFIYTIIMVIIIYITVSIIYNKIYENSYELFDDNISDNDFVYELDNKIKDEIYNIIITEADLSKELSGSDSIFNNSNGRVSLGFMTDNNILVNRINKKIFKILTDCKYTKELKHYNINKMKKKDIMNIIYNYGKIESSIVNPLVETNRYTAEGIQYTTNKQILNIVYSNTNIVDIINKIRKFFDENCLSE